MHTDPIDHIAPIISHTAAGGGLVFALLGWLPPILGLVGAAAATTYYFICIWESRTVQHYVGNWRMRRKAKRIARLKARERILTAELEALEVVREAGIVAKERVGAAAHEAAQLLVQEQTLADIDCHKVARKG